MKHIVLETPRLHLRRMTLDDVPALLRVFGDAEVMRFYPAPFDEARMQRWVAWNQRHDAEHGHGLPQPVEKLHRASLRRRSLAGCVARLAVISFDSGCATRLAIHAPALSNPLRRVFQQAARR